MSSVVCRGLQSCLEPRLVEPYVLRPKSSLPKSTICQSSSSLQTLDAENSYNENNNNDDSTNNNHHHDDSCDNNNLESIKNGDTGGWSFIQALTNPSYDTKEVTEKSVEVYVHPSAKNSASTLSSKSLEMCTESLGSETGSDISSDEFSSFPCEREKMQTPNNDEFSSLSWDSEKMEQPSEFSSLSRLSKNKHRSSHRQFTMLLKHGHNFPPPLTSISGSDGVQVRPHREDGRLILKAVAVSCHTYFQADRSNGRLRLFLQGGCSVHCDNDSVNKKTDEMKCNEEDDQEVLEHENATNLTEEDLDEGCCDEGMEGIGRTARGEVGIGELPRPSRCKEGGRGSEGMTSWGSCCVAIS